MGRQQLQNKQIFHGSAQLQMSSALKTWVSKDRVLPLAISQLQLCSVISDLCSLLIKNGNSDSNQSKPPNYFWCKPWLRLKCQVFGKVLRLYILVQSTSCQQILLRSLVTWRVWKLSGVKRPTSPISHSALSEWHNLTSARARLKPTCPGKSKTRTFLQSWGVFNSEGVFPKQRWYRTTWSFTRRVSEQPKFAIYSDIVPYYFTTQASLHLQIYFWLTCSTSLSLEVI